MRHSTLTTVTAGLLLFAGHPAFAGPGDQANPTPHHLPTLSQLVIPSDLGQVSSVTDGSGLSGKRLILIEDAHVNYDAQKHLAGILDKLASSHGVTLILVEGGAGDVGLSYLRERGSKTAREAVAEERLKTGELSGEEYLDIVSDLPLTIWGVDDPALYDRQYAAFLDVEDARAQAEPALAALRGTVERLRALSPNEPLKLFEVNQAAFETGTLKFAEYAAYLRGEAGRLDVPLEPYAHLWALMESARLESEVDQERVSEEQRAALAQVYPRVPETAWTNFSKLAERHKRKEADAGAYWAGLSALLKEAQIDVASFPALERYLRYMEFRSQGSGQAWWDELAQAQRALRAKLLTSDEERELDGLAERAGRCDRLLRLEWTSGDRDAVQAEPDQVRPSAWLTALEARARQAGLSADPIDAAALEAQLARAVQFYDLAEGRDEALVRRALAKMDEAGRDTAVLIAGGFHTGRIVERLTGAGAEVAVVTPWAGADDEPGRYAAILKAKYADRK